MRTLPSSGHDHDHDHVRVSDDGRRVLTVSERLEFPVPAGITDSQALALVQDGTTAWHLLRTCAHLRADESVVVHEATGGVGALAVQLARSFGAGRVIATESSQARRRRAMKLGADVAVDSLPDGLTERLIEANEGRLVDVVLEPGPTFTHSLGALAPFGRMVCFGDEPQVAVDLGQLLTGSRAIIGFWFAHCLERPEMIASALSELMGLTSAGRLRPVVEDEYPLSEASR